MVTRGLLSIVNTLSIFLVSYLILLWCFCFDWIFFYVIYLFHQKTFIGWTVFVSFPLSMLNKICIKLLKHIIDVSISYLTTRIANKSNRKFFNNRNIIFFHEYDPARIRFAVYTYFQLSPCPSIWLFITRFNFEFIHIKVNI